MNMRDKSRKAFTAPEKSSLSYIDTGCMLRIADSMETLCKSRVEVEADRDFYKKQWEKEQAWTADLRRTVAGLRGYITRLNKGKSK